MSSSSGVMLVAVFLCVCSSPAVLQPPGGRGLPPALPQPLLGRWAAASPARRPRPLWPLLSYQPCTRLETLPRPPPARSLSFSHYVHCKQNHCVFNWDEALNIDVFIRKTSSSSIRCDSSLVVGHINIPFFLTPICQLVLVSSQSSGMSVMLPLISYHIFRSGCLC